MSRAENANALADRLLHAHPARSSLAAIGDAYWRDAGREGPAHPERLPDAIQAFLRHLNLTEGELSEMQPATLHRLVRSGNARDFDEGRIVPVKGWLLGETEARLCAIAALHTA